MTIRTSALFTLLLFALIPLAVSAQSKVDELKSKIDERNKAIEALTKEISAYQEQIKTTSKQAETLQGTIKSLTTTEKKLAAELSVTENKISAAELTIERLSLEIGDKESRLDLHENGLAEMLREMRKADSQSFLESLLGYSRLSLFWQENDRRAQLKARVNSRISELSVVKAGLEETKNEEERVRKELASLRAELADRKKTVEYNKKETNSVLAQTKNTEQNFKKLLADRTARKEAFERELFEFESQLKFELDRSKLPDAGDSVLAWPLANPVITQHFGSTADAKRLYVSGTHNGIDFRAPNGTPIKAALSGKIEATGNTDSISGCYSYGKWILITHGNGLSTLYAHLSVISVTPGQEVSTGQVLGYSGSTGYATGPHLHFSVYATQGVSVQKYTQGKFCKEAVMPVAARNVYLDPMDYLPR